MDAADGEVPCSECPLEKFDRYLEAGPGLVIRNVVDLDFALQVRMHVDFGELSYYEFLLLRILADERNRLQDEVMKKAHGGSQSH